MLTDKKIVTVDWDITMSPSIELYNNFAGLSWDVLESNPQLALCQMNQETAQLLISSILNWVNKIDKNNIHFIMSHEQVVDYIKDDEQYTLINIDHHHDLGYTLDKQELNCGNWVQYLKEKGNITNYVWVKNRNSNINLTDEQKLMTTLMMNIDCASEYLYGIVPDMLIVCLSPEFVPPKFQSWYYFILQTIETVYKNRIKIDYPENCNCGCDNEVKDD